MTYNCTLYLNSGFDAVNIPDSIQTLTIASESTVTVPALEILQDRFLQTIRVKVLSYDQIKDADYCCVNDFYYAIVGIKMTSTDVAELSLSPDFILSAPGGCMGLTFLDGVTERVTVSKNSDLYGAYTEEDPLLAPAQEMLITTETLTPPSSNPIATYTIIESAIDLPATAQDTDGVTYTDPATGNEVTVPGFKGISAQTVHKYGGAHGTASYIKGLANDPVSQGIEKARALGVEGAIIAQYSVPLAFFKTQPTDGFQGALEGKEGDMQTTIPFDEDDGLQNERLQYSNFTKYGILTMSGNRGEFSPSQILEDSQIIPGTTAPRISYKTDLRSDGCPYFRFKFFLGSSSSDDFWRSCLAGAPWQNVPLIYTAPSGNALNRLAFDTERITNLSDTKVTNPSLGFTMQMAREIDAGRDPGLLLQAATAIEDAKRIIKDVGFKGLTRDTTKYINESTRETLNFGISQVRTPDITFPYNGNIMRDALGNGVIVYRYRYTSADKTRIDKLLTMYGYKVTKPLETTDFKNRSKFNYVQARNVQINCANYVNQLPKWHNDGIAAQLAGGVRVWHVKPDYTWYWGGNN